MRHIKRASPEREEEHVKKRGFFNKRFNSVENFIQSKEYQSLSNSFDGYNKFGWLGRTYAKENGCPTQN